MQVKVSSNQKVALDLLIKALKILGATKVGSEHFAYFKKLCEDTLKAIDRWFVEQVKEKGIPIETLPDGENFSITGLTSGTAGKMGLRGMDLEEVQAIVYSQLPDWLDRFDPEKGKLLNMLIKNIKGRSIDHLNMLKKEREHTAPIITEDTEEGGGVPLELLQDIRETSESESEFWSTLEDIRDYLYKTKERFGKVFDMLLEGKTGQEIQEALGVSRGYISQTLNSIREEIANFARQTGNPELESAAEALKGKYFVRSSEFGVEFLPIVEEAYAEGIDLADRQALTEYIDSRNARGARTYLSSISSDNFKNFSRFLKEYIEWAK